MTYDFKCHHYFARLIDYLDKCRALCRSPHYT
jgi:hypothetical protein